MFCRSLIRILFISVFACAYVGTLRAGNETFSEEEIRELAEAYLDNPTYITPLDDGQPHLFTPDETTTRLLEPAPNPSQRLPHCIPEKEGYTVNFEDISVIQLIQFISKISGVNYIFDTNDLNFKITIVSEDPTSVTNLSAALLQILKIHGLSVVEQGNNVLIYRGSDISRLSTVITDRNVNQSCDAAIVTRVFRLTNVDPNGIVGIIKPLLSADAVVEVSPETFHLIVTDITANVNKVGELLTAIDTPIDSPLEIKQYSVKSSYPAALVEFAREILNPFHTENQPLLMIPQVGAKKIFIVSTPFLVEKAIQVLKSLDISDVTEGVGLPASSMANSNFHMYKLKYQNGEDIAEAIHQIGANLQDTGVSNVEFVNTIYSVKYIEVNNSIIITGTQASINKVIELIDDLDTAPKQVYIEVLILDTTLSDSLDFGVQWIALGDEQDKLAYASGLLNNDPPGPTLAGGAGSPPGARFVAANPAAGPPLIPNPGRDVSLPFPSTLSGNPGFVNQSAAFGLGIIGNIIRHNGRSFLTLGALLSALDQDTSSKVVLNPRVMVEDTHPATFFVGQNIPYQTTSTVIQQTGSVTQNIQYEDIGVNLSVTPTISPNNVVTLDISQSIVELEQQVINNIIAPRTSKILSSTRVHVPDGTFLALSGQVRDSAVEIHSGIPCLGTLPLIGPTFSRNIESREKRNLIFFVRPKVITNIQEGLDLTNQEGYNHNWDSDPCSIIECGPKDAPECETYPPPPCPTH